jgi:copper chaperone CopZ
MKSFIKATLLALALSPVAALADEAIDVKITGMTCGACTSAVKKGLAGLKGVDKKSISVELEGNHAVLKVKKNDEKTQAAIKASSKKLATKSLRLILLRRHQLQVVPPQPQPEILKLSQQKPTRIANSRSKKVARP